MTQAQLSSSLPYRPVSEAPIVDRSAAALPPPSAVLRSDGIRTGHESIWTKARRALSILSFSALIASILAFGWIRREDEIITPQSGIGYFLGIAGSVMMLLLLLYPMRKRYPVFRWLGSVPSWFRLHMILGILGPTLIVLHSNFGVGALNSAVSLAAMLLVVFSGIVGRFLYAKTHRGLYGKREDLTTVRANAENIRLAMALPASLTQKIAADLAIFEERAIGPRRGIFGTMVQIAAFGLRSRHCQRATTRQLQAVMDVAVKDGSRTRRESRKLLRESQRRLKDYFRAAKAVVRFSLYEHLFALWHVLHMPLFILLVLTAIAHVIAVHLY